MSQPLSVIQNPLALHSPGDSPCGHVAESEVMGRCHAAGGAA